jgi:hypothetical protein
VIWGHYMYQVVFFMWRTPLAVNKISAGGLTANGYALD